MHLHPYHTAPFIDPEQFFPPKTMLVWLIAAFLFIYICVGIFMLLTTPEEATQEDLNRKKHAVVAVFGDLGHSPRMSLHALSIAKCGWNVSLLGYRESDPMADISQNENINIVALPTPAKRSGIFIFWAIKRVIVQHWQFFKALRSLGRIDVLLVQNPPSIPTLGVARIYTIFFMPGCKLLIDWHNLGYTIMALSTKKWAAKLYKMYEMFFGHIAYLHVCVSIRLGRALQKELYINPKRIMPVYDRPWKSYVANEKQVKETRKRLDMKSKFTNAKWVVTSTSYTPDEDLLMLLDALEIYDKNPKAIPLEVIVTGKGPLKSQFSAMVTAKPFNNVKIHQVWLSYEDYHHLLAACDLGISLHLSSSGFDLPMKVVDMFGAGLPVAALEFPALGELVNENNGVTFKNAKGLANSLLLLNSINCTQYARIKTGALKEAHQTWFDVWQHKLGPVFGYGQYTGFESSSDDDF